MLAAVPIPGIDQEQLDAFLASNPLFGLLNIFSGGGLSNLSVVALGMNPYINASIIMQLMQGVVPSLQALSREGEYGRNKITQYTRYLSVPLALLQAYGFLALLNSQGVLTGTFDLGQLRARSPRSSTLTAGSVALMWIGELITERGIGNGISFIIFAGIVSQAPGAIGAFVASPERRRVHRLRHRRHRGGRRDHLHPGRPAPHPGPVRQPCPRPAHVLGRSDLPAAAGQPRRRLTRARSRASSGCSPSPARAMRRWPTCARSHASCRGLVPAVDRLAARLDRLAARGIEPAGLRFEASYGRTTLEYYDGFVFGASAPSRPDLAAIASGGRYDALTRALGGGRGIPAVGGIVRPEALVALCG